MSKSSRSRGSLSRGSKSKCPPRRHPPSDHTRLSKADYAAAINVRAALGGVGWDVIACQAITRFIVALCSSPSMLVAALRPRCGLRALTRLRSAQPGPLRDGHSSAEQFGHRHLESARQLADDQQPGIACCGPQCRTGSIDSRPCGCRRNAASSFEVGQEPLAGLSASL